ncbi:hypothetical protein CKO23_11990 [Thiocystis violacea]|nr:hypothetical protein [Thiocystis violacea]
MQDVEPVARERLDPAIQVRLQETAGHGPIMDQGASNLGDPGAEVTIGLRIQCSFHDCFSVAASL